MSSRKAARSFIEKGWALIPAPHGEKGTNLRGWPDLRVSEEDVDKYFSTESNIGILTGDASGGLIDIDLRLQKEGTFIVGWSQTESDGMSVGIEPSQIEDHFF